MAELGEGSSAQTQQQQNGFQKPDPSNNNDSTWGGRRNSGDKGGRGQRNPCPTKTYKPCPTKTYKPCPPKPCEPVWTKPCKDKGKDGYGHVTAYAKAKRTYVCKPKPCPTKSKPCPPKCKKNVHHKHDRGSRVNGLS